MKVSRITTLALAVTLTGGLLGAVQPVQAQNLGNILQSTLGGRGNTGLAANQGTIQNNVNVGISNLQNSIQANLATGKLSPAQASTLDAQLGQLMSMRDQSMSVGGYTNQQVQTILSAFQQMNSQISSFESTNTAAGLTPGYGYGNAYTGISGYGGLQASVNARIENGAARGSLTPTQANSLRRQYSQIISRGSGNPAGMGNRLQSLNARITQFESRTAGGSYFH